LPPSRTGRTPRKPIGLNITALLLYSPDLGGSIAFLWASSSLARVDLLLRLPDEIRQRKTHLRLNNSRYLKVTRTFNEKR
jgi:hypothetical protein